MPTTCEQLFNSVEGNALEKDSVKTVEMGQLSLQYSAYLDDALGMDSEWDGGIMSAELHLSLNPMWWLFHMGLSDMSHKPGFPRSFLRRCLS